MYLNLSFPTEVNEKPLPSLLSDAPDLVSDLMYIWLKYILSILFVFMNLGSLYLHESVVWCGREHCIQFVPKTKSLSSANVKR